MIIEHLGDIFLAPTDIIVQSCNCFHTMGAGFAKEIRERFPEVYETDCNKTVKGDITKLGSFNFTKVSSSDNPRLKYICNVYGQFRYGNDKRYTSYDALTEAFEHMEEAALLRKSVPTLAVPFKIGCNLGGGSWNVVKAILYDIFENSSVDLLICRLE